MTGTCILFPCEIINRDLDFQLALAARTIVRHGDVRFLIGRFDTLHRAAQSIRNAVWIGKAFDPFFPSADLSDYQALKRRQISVVHLDDEGAVFPGRQSNWKTTLLRRFDPSRVDHDDTLFTWGRYQQEVFAEAGFPRERIRLTGHPRFDMFRPDYRSYWGGRVEELKRRYGDYVLLNTNLSTANNALGLNYSFTPRWHYHAGDPTRRKLAIAFWGHTSRILISFVELVHALAEALPRGAVVVRPHPSEDPQFYRTVTRGLTNVHVIHEGPVTPWLLASRVLVHNGCTTAIESGTLGLPIVNFRPVEDPELDLYLPNLFGQVCTRVPEVVEVAQAAMLGHAPNAEPTTDPLARSLLENLSRPTFDVFGDALDEVLARVGPSRVDERVLRTQALLMEGVDVARAQVRRLTPERARIGANTRVKFYGFALCKVPVRLATLGRMFGVSLKSRLLSDSLLEISAARSAS